MSSHKKAHKMVIINIITIKYKHMESTIKEQKMIKYVLRHITYNKIDLLSTCINGLKKSYSSNFFTKMPLFGRIFYEKYQNFL